MPHELPTELRLLAYSAIQTWLMIVVAAGLKARFDLGVMFGNRDSMDEPTPLAGRAARAAANMLENMALFAAVVIATIPSHDHDRVVLGARIFFWARLAYFPVYLLGVPYLRTALWATGVAGMGLMLSTVL